MVDHHVPMVIVMLGRGTTLLWGSGCGVVLQLHGVALLFVCGVRFVGGAVGVVLRRGVVFSVFLLGLSQVETQKEPITIAIPCVGALGLLLPAVEVLPR